MNIQDAEAFDDDFEGITSGFSPDFRSELAERLAELAPEVVADGKIDVAKLQELLGEDAGDAAERFGLFWPGKRRALSAAQAPTSATLRPDQDASKDWDTTQNVFIEGDNLEVLKVLQKHYHNKVKMIYIDPPYNTGKDFVYPDNYKEGLDSYLEWTKQVNEEGKKLSSNSETEGRYHSNWLNMMYPRLKLARNLLTNDGVVFVSIGESELTNLQRMMFEIFGESNALPILTRVTKKSSNNGTTFSPCTDYVVAFARDLSVVGPFSVPMTEEQVKSYNKTDNRGAYKEIGLYQAALKHGGSRYPITVPDGSQVITPEGMPWRWSEGKFEAGLVADQIVFKQTFSSPLLDPQSGLNSSWNVYTKLHLVDREEAGLLPKNFLEGFQNNLGTRELKKLDLPFDFPKPVGFVGFLGSLMRDSSALVLDLFAGSATTAHAVMALNAEDGGSRRFVMVQLPEPTPEDSEARKAGFSTIAEISRERIRRAGDAIRAEQATQLGERETPLDVGFRAFKLSDSNFVKWRLPSDIEPGALGEHLVSLRGSADDDASPEDLLTEVLLKQGYSLTEQISLVDIAGLSAYSVGDGTVLAYLNEHVKPSLDQLRALAEAGPARLIVLEDAYQGDDELKTNLEQICRSKYIELWRA